MDERIEGNNTSNKFDFMERAIERETKIDYTKYCPEYAFI